MPNSTKHEPSMIQEEPGGAGEPTLLFETLTTPQRELYDYLCMEEAMMNTDKDMTSIARGVFNYVRFLTGLQAEKELARMLD